MAPSVCSQPECAAPNTQQAQEVKMSQQGAELHTAAGRQQWHSSCDFMLTPPHSLMNTPATRDLNPLQKGGVTFAH